MLIGVAWRDATVDTDTLVTMLSTTFRHVWAWLKIWAPVAICVAAILIESTNLFSGGHTGHILRPAWERVFGAMSDARWDVIHFRIRKTGHFTGYGLTGAMFMRAWKLQWSGWFVSAKTMVWRSGSMALACTAVVASYDEVHQSYLPSRTGQASDVLLDCCGALTAILIVSGVTLLRRRQAAAS